MIAFGLLVLLIAGIIAGFALAAGSDPAVVNLLGFDIETTERWQFATGALCALAALIGIRIMVIGGRRARRRRRELRQLRETVVEARSPTSSRRDRDRGHDEWEAPDDSDERDHFDSTPHE